VYSKGALFLNWVVFYSAYPVIRGDMDKLTGKSNYTNYDAHYIPVVAANEDNPHEKVYYPCSLDQEPQYTEVVVFDSAACLPRFVVTLQATLLRPMSVKLSSTAERNNKSDKTDDYSARFSYYKKCWRRYLQIQKKILNFWKS